jgi:nucleoside-diphosphate-sugar epimerase
MAKVLVTGANGFIGSHLCEHLLSGGNDVVGLVRPTSDVRPLVPLMRAHGTRFRLLLGDLLDEQSLKAPVEGVDYVYHLAAKVMGTSEDEFRSPIVTGTKHLIKAVFDRSGPPLRRFLYVSSQAAAGPSPTSAPLTETDPPQPVSWYGRAKRDAEQLVRGEASRLAFTIIRPVAVYGERECDLSGGTFPVVQARILPRIGLHVKTVTTVYVGDLVAGMVAAAESPATVGKTYFLADPAPITSSLMVAAVAGAMDAIDQRNRIRVPVFVPQPLLGLFAPVSEWIHYFTRQRPQLTRDKYREVKHRHWAASAMAAQSDFGWTASTSLANGMQRAVKDWRQRERVQANIVAQPDNERALQTYVLALGSGILCEGLSYATKLYQFNPKWFIVIAVLGYFGVLLGTLTYLTADWKKLWQFVASAVVFLVVEMSNYYWLKLWDFSGGPMGNLNPWLRAGILAVPIGLIPVVINAIIGAIYRHRLRVG